MQNLSTHWGQWHTVPGAGHWVIYENAHRFNAALQKVLTPI
jgi:pimeloyl-ACP methyl ester carboxylesterase